MDEPKSVYIIDVYHKYCRDKIISTFFINGIEYALKEVTLEWGIPQLSLIEEALEQPYFKLYNSIEEARKYIKQLKKLEGMKF